MGGGGGTICKNRRYTKGVPLQKWYIKGEGKDVRAEQTLFSAPTLRGYLITNLDGAFMDVTMFEF